MVRGDSVGKELFNNIPSKVGDLLNDVKNGKIGLPDLQRPFVWKDNKVRELLDSMMKGYPIGYIMLWSSPEDYENTGHIGNNTNIYSQPDDLVIDGQQRLTALLASMYGYVGFLFLDKNEQPMVAMHWEKYFQHICDKYNSIYKIQLPRITPHV